MTTLWKQGRAPRQRSRRRKSSTNRALTVGLTAVAIVWLLPLLILILTAVKPSEGIVTSGPFSLPPKLVLSNFSDAWRQAAFSTYLRNSLVICAIKVPLGLLISSMMAFGFSAFRYRFRHPLLVVIIAGAMVPLQVPLIPLFRMLLDANLLNTYPGLILPYLALGLPFQVIFLTAFFQQIPLEVEEAARLDGCGPWRYFVQILLPLSKPILVSLLILDLVATWNEFPIALTVLQDSARWTVPLGLMAFAGPYSSQYTLISAAVLMAALPVLVMFMTLQRYFVRGFTAGAVKG